MSRYIELNTTKYKYTQVYTIIHKCAHNYLYTNIIKNQTKIYTNVQKYTQLYTTHKYTNNSNRRLVIVDVLEWSGVGECH